MRNADRKARLDDFNGINIFDSPEKLRTTTASVRSPSVSAGFSINIKALECLDAKPALTLGLPTRFQLSRLDFPAGQSNILMP
jgi:hypothetical protein